MTRKITATQMASNWPAEMPAKLSSELLPRKPCERAEQAFRAGQLDCCFQQPPRTQEPPRVPAWIGEAFEDAYRSGWAEHQATAQRHQHIQQWLGNRTE